MRRRRLPFLAILLVAGLALPTWGRALDVPRAFDAGRGDAQLVQVTAPDGRIWAAWSYDAGAESDIAVSVRSAEGTWSAPAFVGAGSGADEGFPSLAVDARGTLYLAFGVRSGGWIGLSMSVGGSGTWTSIARATPVGEFASRPTVRVLRDRLVLAYRTATGTALLDFPVDTGETRTNGIQDGPDILPPTGNSSGGGSSLPGGSGSPFGPKR